MLRLLTFSSILQRRWTIILTSILLVLVLSHFNTIPSVRSAILTVNSNDDITDANGCDATHCSLREAILAANSSVGQPDIIDFNLPGPDYTIAIGVGTLTLTDPVTIDGTTQSDADCAAWPPTLLIELDGSGGAAGQPGLQIDPSASGSTIRGLVINRFDTSGIWINTGTGNVAIECNFIGTDSNGAAALGNGSGIYSGSDELGNRIGGTSTTQRNLISGNNDEGIRFIGASNFTIQGNYIGTDVSGTAPLGNLEEGVFFDASSNNLLGGTDSGAGNIIADNGFNGVRLELNSSNNVIQGNGIGTDITGALELGNAMNGIFVLNGSSDNLIEDNSIAFNVGNGVRVTNPTTLRNQVSSNRIFSNGVLGISLGNVAGPIPNDPGDGDTGPNNLQNFPDVTAVTFDSVEALATGTLNTSAGTLRIEFFRNDTCDASTNGEGQEFLGASDVTSPGGIISFDIALVASITVGDIITATATDAAGNTSEFSSCVTVIPAPRYESNPIVGSTTLFSAVEGTPESTFIDVSNPGLDDLEITNVTLSDTTNFTLLSGTSFTVPPGDLTAQDIVVQCNAITTTGSPFTTTITVTHNAAGSEATYTLECNVTLAPRPDYSANYDDNDTIDFGPTVVNSTSSLPLTITNAGVDADLDVRPPDAPTLLIDGPHASDFNVDVVDIPTMPPGLAPGFSDDITITCTPSGTGLRTATLTLATNDPDPGDDIISYNLTCTGVPSPALYVSSEPINSTINIGSSPVNTPVTSDPAFTITNTGGTDMTVSFAVSTGDTSNFSVPAGDIPVAANNGTYDVSITCTPDAAGLRTTLLTVTHSAAGSPATYTLNCTGTAPGYLSTPSSGTILFDNTPVNTPTTKIDALVIDNTGNADLTVSFSVDNAAEFSVPGGPFTIQPDDDPVEFAMTCTPSSAGIRTATLTVTHNAPTGSTVPYTLTCTGTAAVYTSTPDINETITLGPTQVGTPITNANALVIQNDGDAPLTITDFSVDNTEFIVNTADNITIPASGGQQNVSITCNPADTGSRTGTLTVAHSATGSPATYPLECTGLAVGTPAYISTPNPGETIDLGDVTVLTTVNDTQALTITNTGSAPLTINLDLSGGDAGDFAMLSLDTATLPVAGDFDVSISCTPSVTGTRSTTLTVNHNAAGNVATYPVTCNGTAAPVAVYDANPASGTPIDLGSSPVGTLVNLSPALTINNSGTADLTLSFALGGTNPGDFTITPSDTTVTPSGTPVQVGVTCTPGATGLREATLTVTHNAAGGTATYPLTCTGTPTTGTPIYDANPTDGTAINIGSSAVGTLISLSPAITINNSGTADLTLSFALGGTNPGDFTFTTSGNTVTPSGTPVQVGVTCTPSAIGPRQATLIVTHNAAGGTANYTLNCTGTTTPTGPGYSSSPAPNSTITINTSPGTEGTATLTISEIGDQPLTITSYALTGSQAAMNVLSISSGPSFPFTINDGGTSQTIRLSCFSNSAGTFTGSFSVVHNATGSPATYNVSCVVAAAGNPGYASVPAPGSTINVGTVQIGTSISTNLLVSNPGSGTLTVLLPAIPPGLISGPNAAEFAIIGNSPNFSVQPNSSQTVAVTIRCTPTGAGLRVAILTFRTNVPGNLGNVSYALNCTGSGTPVSTATPIGFVATASPFVPTPTPILPATGTVSNDVTGLAMRTGPYLGATLVGAIRPGTQYSILAQSNDESTQFTWYLVVDDNGVTGWVSGRFLVVTGNLPIPFQGSVFDTLDNAPDIGVTARAMAIIDIRRRPSGRAAILGQIPQDATISILGRTRQNGGDFWVQVRYNGIVGWIPAAPIDVHGTTQNVPIR